jgi:sigma-B regulation protein RsbU (phosphoserine phosphatase)
VGLISLFLFLFTRTRREYLWAGIVLTGVAIVMACDVVGRLTPIPIQIMFACRYVGIWIGLSAGPIFVMHLLGVHKSIWRRLNYILIVLLTIGIAIELSIHLGFAPPTTGWEGATDVLRFAALGNALLVLAIAIDGVRTLGSKAWLPLTPGLLGACGLVLELAGGQFPAIVSGLMLLVPVALLIVFLLRAAQQHRENEQYLLDMRQAQEVQHLLLPEKLPQVAGFKIDSFYLPAREVGGDFFQVLETQTGSILIVFGDVAGKGLPAAMLVAMLVGAIRTRARETGDPAKILGSLNDRLCGNTRGGFATCIAVHISSAGAVHLANAGHLEPYLNGKEIGLEGALPLGVAAGNEFVATSFFLRPGDRLTFVSDGVVEATNSHKELFGFDRVREISSKEAQQIADAAKQFGQEDDITVLTVQRLPAPA